MLQSLAHNRTIRFLGTALALSALAACNDSTGPDDHDHGEHADEVHAIRLTITQGGTANTVTFEEGVMPPGLSIPVGQSVAVATFLAEDGDVLGDVDASEHTFSIESISPASAMTFTRTSPFTGTVDAPSAGEATATVCLMHLDHCDLEFRNVPVTIGG